jgi:predicted  nucleic acid-binding Zn-ribbon protein
MQQTYQQIKDLLTEVEDDIQKAADGNKAAGTRVRKQMQEVKSKAQELRQQVLDNRSSEG